MNYVTGLNLKINKDLFVEKLKKSNEYRETYNFLF